MIVREWITNEISATKIR